MEIKGSVFENSHPDHIVEMVYDIRDAWLDGETLQAIGDRYDRTREWARIIIANKLYPDELYDAPSKELRRNRMNGNPRNKITGKFFTKDEITDIRQSYSSGTSNDDIKETYKLSQETYWKIVSCRLFPDFPYPDRSKADLRMFKHKVYSHYVLNDQDLYQYIFSNFKLEEETECWTWKGGARRVGSGKYIRARPVFRHKRELYYAYRVSWFLSYGFPIEHAFDCKISLIRDCLDYLCINPDHYHLSWRKMRMIDEKNRKVKVKAKA